MKAYLHVTMPNGRIYEIPTALIAENRAAYYHEHHKDEFPTPEAAMADTTELFADDYEIADWAKNNMDWSDVEKQARMIAVEPGESLEAAWTNAEITAHAERTQVAEIFRQGGALLPLPLELLMTGMAENGNICSCIALTPDPETPPAGAIAVVRGPYTTLFLHALQSTTEFIAQRESAAASQSTAH